MKPLTRLVVATPLYPPDLGGPATYSYLLEQELPKRGITIELVKFADVRHLPKLVRYLAYFFNVLKALRTKDAVLALDPVSVGLPSMLAARVARKPLFLKVGGDYAWEQGTQRLRSMCLYTSMEHRFQFGYFASYRDTLLCTPAGLLRRANTLKELFQRGEFLWNASWWYTTGFKRRLKELSLRH